MRMTELAPIVLNARYTTGLIYNELGLASKLDWPGSASLSLALRLTRGGGRMGGFASEHVVPQLTYHTHFYNFPTSCLTWTDANHTAFDSSSLALHLLGKCHRDDQGKADKALLKGCSSVFAGEDGLSTPDRILFSILPAPSQAIRRTEGLRQR